MPDPRPSIQAKVSRAEDVATVLEFKKTLAGFGVKEAAVVMELVRAYLETVNENNGAIPRPPFTVKSRRRNNGPTTR